MPINDDLYRELLAGLDSTQPIIPEPTPSDREAAHLMDEAAAGMDVFLADQAQAPTMQSPVDLEGLWDTPEGGHTVEAAEPNLEALFMQGYEARAAAEVIQGRAAQGPDLPIFAPPPEDFRQEDQIQFDHDMMGAEMHAPNNAVRWTVGREDAPPAAPPMRSGANRQDGQVVGSFQDGRFVPQARPPRTMVTHQATTTSPSTPSSLPIPDTTRPALPPTLYDHLLED